MLALHPDLAILDVGGPEILVIMTIMLLLFGTERLPELARSMGKTIREFKKMTSGLEDELKRALDTPPPRNPPIKATFPPAPPKSAPAPDSSAPQAASAPPGAAPEAPPPAGEPEPPDDFRYP
jgi:sec-independent protein translocase protein TatA